MFGNSLRSFGVVAIGLVFSLAAIAAEGDKPAAKDGDEGGKKEVKVQTTCPVMGGKINKDIYVDHDGKRVYFCCKACPAMFNKDPEKYIKKLEDEGVTLEKAPAKDESKDGSGAKSGTDAHGAHHDSGAKAKMAGGCCN